MIHFEWDERKAEANLTKHGVSFQAASAVFLDPFALDIEERSMDYGEIRRRIIGLGNGRFLTVIYTERGDVIRLISARKSTAGERQEYDDAKW
ncbi:uncharacterized DUF497 family protein [Neorhizobium huautlense]|uniref:Uncharacterized DUF497 family protein n=1 Tax=Neorhizobium huautlense TaxID=67774 RepID=A0ABT9PYQ2_9HYPH|nr:BrnT family toxin [Neorhizobium huautlense]MDP9839618.1 uncharacterized DUF497 family protein [Neorhizobium huautlense]